MAERDVAAAKELLIKAPTIDDVEPDCRWLWRMSYRAVAECAAREAAERERDRLEVAATMLSARAEAAEQEAKLLRVSLAQIKDRTLGDSYGMGNDIAVIVEAALEDQRITKEE